MLMSAGPEIKFHFWRRIRDDLIYKSSVESPCICASWSRDNSFLTLLCDKAMPEIISLKNLRNVNLIHTISAVSDVSCLCFKRTTKRCIALGTETGQMAMYDTSTKTVSKMLGNVPSPVRFVDFNSRDEHLSAACVDGNAVLYDLSDGHVCSNYVVSENAEPTALKFHPQQPHILAASSREGTVMLWDTTTSKRTFVAQTYTSPICGMAFGKVDNDVVVTAYENNTFCIYDIRIGQCVFKSCVQHPLSAVDVSPDGRTISIGSKIGTIISYDVRNFSAPIAIWKAQTSKITKIAYENSTRRFAPLDIVANSEAPCTSQTHQSPKPTELEKAIDNAYKPDIRERQPSNASCDKLEEEKRFLNDIIAGMQKEGEEAKNKIRTYRKTVEKFVDTEFQHTSDQMTNQMEDSLELVNLALLHLREDGNPDSGEEERSDVLF